MNPAVILAMGEPAARSAAAIARDLLDLARAGALDEGGRAEAALDHLADSRPAVAALRGEVQDRVFRLEAILTRLDQVATYLDRDLAAVRDLQGQADRAAASPTEAEQVVRMLSNRVVHLEGARQSLMRSRALLLELLSTERLAADQLGLMGDVTAALAFRKSRMEMLAERAARAAAMTGEIDDTASGLIARGRAALAPRAPVPLRRGWLGLRRARG